MTWRIEGSYLENCNCEVVCPCTINDSWPADYDRCRLLMVYHIEVGEIEGTDVSGLTVAQFADTPPVMADGNWRVGLLLDAAAAPDQAQKIQAFFAGKLGGVPEMLQPLIAEDLGTIIAPISYSDDGRTHCVRIGDAVDVTIEDLPAAGSEGAEPVTLTGMNHPANSTLTVARATKGMVKAFGLEFSTEGRNGHWARFSWSA